MTTCTHQYWEVWNLYKTSGHWDHYQDDMFPVMEMDNEAISSSSDELSSSYDGV